jgi:fructose-specific PTS system IIA-like component
MERAPAAEFEFECKLSSGLHARPASHLAEIARRFAADCSLTNLRNRASADVKSVLATIAADVRPGDACLLRVEGADQAEATAALRRVIAEELPGCDEPPAAALSQGSEPKLPRGLESTGAHYLFGLPVSGGIGQGQAVVLDRITVTADFAKAPADHRADPAVEHERLERGLAGVRARVEGLLSRSRAGVEAAILKAHLAILDDAALRREVARRIHLGHSAAQAVEEAGEHFSGLLHRSENGCVRERAVDVQELCAELLEEMYGARSLAASELPPVAAELRAPSIVAARTLAPHQLLALDRQWLQGIVLESAGATSHAVILARSMGIPTVVGAAGAVRLIAPGEQAIVDGNRGLVFPHCSAPVRQFYRRERAAQQRRQSALAQFASAPAVSADGERIEIGANISSAAEAAPAFENGADGIGLFRTELLFAGRSAPPAEDEQFAAYAEVVRAAGGRPVILRTADIGGDKPLPYLKLPVERNPFLGYRGIRIYPEHSEWIGVQLRAALRASAIGPVWLMAPMIASIEEALWFKSEVARAKDELRAQGAAFDARMRLGAMIEVPAAAFLLDQLCADLDFFSIGTNDLSQYFFAADRENPKLASVANVRVPAFLALLQRIASEVRARHKWIGLCGEMAGDPRHLPLLFGLGLDEISVSANAIPALKRSAARLSASVCRELLGRAIACGAAAEVERLLDSAARAQDAEPLLATSLVTLRSDSRDKDEAIREIVDALYAAGRVDDPRRMEDAVWARESVYATGLGHGFAIPHCRTDAVSANSIGILKFDRPIEWGPPGGLPVRMVILLAIRESGHNGLHMKVFSRLARKLMDEEFRSRLMEIDDSGEIVSHLGRELEDAVTLDPVVAGGQDTERESWPNHKGELANSITCHEDDTEVCDDVRQIC